MRRAPCFDRGDWICAGLAALVSFAVYAWTTAPNVTLLDSGEFMTAAAHFGVPHPSGYPLWTLLAWLFTLLPLGNAAWEINLFSGVLGGMAVGLAALLARGCLRWLFGSTPGFSPALASLTSLSGALLFAFSFSMWSQAVITEIYTLHALLMALYLISIYRWLQAPSSTVRMVAPFFFLALAFTSHFLTVVLTPLPLLAVLLVRRRAFLDLVMASLLTVLLAYLGLAILSQEPAVLKTSIRFFYCVMTAFAIFLWWRRFRIRWKIIAYLPFAVALGLLPFAYMPLASSTNPPMNWAYARDPAGFFYSINRSQYPKPLTELSVTTLGRFMGSAPGDQDLPNKPEDSGREDSRSFFSIAQDWAGFFWLQLARSFTPLSMFAYFAAFFAALRLPDVKRRTWIYLIHIAFLLAAFTQPLMERTRIDRASWWLQMPYHAYTNLFYGLLTAMGGYYLLAALYRKYPRLRPSMVLVAALPLSPLFVNYQEVSQRNHWFGWQFGYDMLKDLPPGAVIFGGTDPGRFVPTYMIFGESPQPAKNKRDPNFDRRDLYLITQNGLGEEFYTRYILDHYGKNRPKASTAFEHWLGRDTAYPADALDLPDWEKTRQILRENEKTMEGSDTTVLQAAVARWIWEHNKEKHAFFVEESFPMEWSYDYAVPHGLVYQILPEKLEKLPPDAVARDFAFWKAYIARLKADPNFSRDYDAQRSFSKLRQSQANIYRHRKMNAEAIRACREALSLWPANPECLSALVGLLWEENRPDEVTAAIQAAINEDPNNMAFWRFLGFSKARQEIEGEIQTLSTELERQPRNRDVIEKLIILYSRVGETNKAEQLIEQTVRDFPEDVELMRKAAGYYALGKQEQKALEPAQRLVKLEPSNASNHYGLARVWFALDKKKEFYEAAGKAVDLGGWSVREALESDPILAPWRKDKEFKKLIRPALNPQP